MSKKRKRRGWRKYEISVDPPIHSNGFPPEVDKDKSETEKPEGIVRYVERREKPRRKRNK